MRQSLEEARNIWGTQPVVAAEIGVHRGDNAWEILESFNIKTLYLIDTWSSTNFLLDTIKKLKSHKEKILFQITTSDKVVDQIPDNSLNFVYIDGCHIMPYVLNDINQYYPKVMSGGVVGGHDYAPKDLKVHVKEAVDYWIKRNGFKLYTDKRSTDWWIVK